MSGVKFHVKVTSFRILNTSLHYFLVSNAAMKKFDVILIFDSWYLIYFPSPKTSRVLSLLQVF
jgi:hypothetical protein